MVQHLSSRDGFPWTRFRSAPINIQLEEVVWSLQAYPCTHSLYKCASCLPGLFFLRRALLSPLFLGKVFDLGWSEVRFIILRLRVEHGYRRLCTRI